MQMVDLKTSGDLAVIFTCKSNLMVFTSPQLVLEYSPFKRDSYGSAGDLVYIQETPG